MRYLATLIVYTTRDKRGRIYRTWRIVSNVTGRQFTWRHKSGKRINAQAMAHNLLGGTKRRFFAAESTHKSDIQFTSLTVDLVSDEKQIQEALAKWWAEDKKIGSHLYAGNNCASL